MERAIRGHITRKGLHKGTARVITYSAATDTSSPSPFGAADGVASMSSVQTTISATISESASEDEGLAGVESSTLGLGVEDGRLLRLEGVARAAPFTAPEEAPSPDQLSLRFLALADLPIVRGGSLLQAERRQTGSAGQYIRSCGRAASG